ncbi:glycosyltransferase [candidate division GN15 bacterium]|nr:glycosyltransferase [candidate division GN15 bacterium]
MKILFVNSLYYPNVVGGAERSLQLLAESLAAAGEEIVVLSTDDETHSGMVNGVRVYYVRSPNLYWMRTAKSQPAYKKPLWHMIDSYNPRVRPIVSDIIAKEKPEILHTNNLAGLSVAVWHAARDHRLPIVHTIRDHYLLCARGLMYHKGRECEPRCGYCRALAWPRRRAARLVDAVVGVSRFILDKHLRFGYFANTCLQTHIYNSVGIAAQGRRRRRTTDDFVFGYVGQLAPAKGIEFLLQRFKRLNKPGTRLRVFGRALNEAYVRMLREQYGGRSVEFLGHCAIEDVYPAVDTVVIPSLCDDAFPRTLIESYSFGVPVIATTRGGAAEMLVEGETGFLFDPGREGDIEDRLSRMADTPELVEQFAPACLKVASELTGELVVQRYRETYQTVLTGYLR